MIGARRIVLGAIACAALFIYAYRPAEAVVEFCPAWLTYAQVRAASATAPSDLYGFELNAMGPRTISESYLMFYTTAGWYTIGLQNVALQEKKRHYTGASSAFVRHDYVSPVLYVRFPEPLAVMSAWVLGASAQNDGSFGWQAQGMVRCDPPAGAYSLQSGPTPGELTGFVSQTGHEALGNMEPYRLAPADEDHLSDAPTSRSPVFTATPSQPLLSTNCEQPFRQAAFKDAAMAQYPDSYNDSNGVTLTYPVVVEVALDGNGTVRDAWVWAPSGFKAFDDEAVRAARASTYEGARAFCQPVPSIMYYAIKFLTH